MAAQRVKIGLIVAAVVAFGIQLVPVARTNPPATAPLEASADVMRVLDRACADLVNRGHEVWIEKDAGVKSGFSDAVAA